MSSWIDEGGLSDSIVSRIISIFSQGVNYLVGERFNGSRIIFPAFDNYNYQGAMGFKPSTLSNFTNWGEILRSARAATVSLASIIARMLHGL